MEKPIIVITGPTASGKSALSLEIAGKYNGEIICADSMTVYRGMDIGTDKPGVGSTSSVIPAKAGIQKKNDVVGLDSSLRWNDGARVIGGIPHHLLDIINPDEEFNVALFVKEVRKLVDDIHARGKVPFLVGGSLMYIDAFIYDYDMPEVAPNVELREELEKLDNEELFARLCELDPDCEWTVDRHNKRRIIRAIEICMATGKSLAEQKSKKPLPKNILYLAVDKDRDELYAQIDKRVDIMFQQGFVDEVRKLREKYDQNTAMQAAGYKQIMQYLDGEIDLESAIAKTKQVHRNFAKRQLTWLRRNTDVNWVKNADEASAQISNFIK